MSFEELEQIDGVRFNWNLFPSTRLEASQLGTQLACIYTPNHQRGPSYQPIPSTAKSPIQCSTCQNYVNPFIKVDRANRMWWCPFCQKRSFLPQEFELPEAPQNVDDWPIELRQTSSTLEYELPEDISLSLPKNLPLAFVFTIDLYQHVEDAHDSPFRALLTKLAATIERLPDDSLVGLVTYDERVTVHRFERPGVCLGLEDIAGNSAFKVKTLFEEPAVMQTLELLGIEKVPLGTVEVSPLLTEGILTRINPQTKSSFIQTVLALKPTPTNTYRPPRSSGLSQYILSIVLSTSSYKHFIGKCLFFTTGPCTIMPGLVLDLNQGQTMRSHTDITGLNASDFIPSSRFYQSLAYVANGQTIERAFTICHTSSKKPTNYELQFGSPTWSTDIFVGSIDQVGLFEMKSLATLTMGNIHLLETFSSYRLQKCLSQTIMLPNRVFNTLTITTSQDLRISRMIGDIGYALPSSYGQASKFHDEHHEKISDTLTHFDSSVAKKCFTNRWWFNQLTNETSLGIQFEMKTKRSEAELSSKGSREIYIQFQLKYWDFASKRWKLRMTTIEKPTTLSVIFDKKSDRVQRSLKVLKEHQMLKSFDQECWVVILSRLLIHRIDSSLGYDNFDDMVSLLDRTIVRLLYHFGGLKLNLSNAGSSNPYLSLQQIYAINENFKNVPSLAYNLRRNPQLLRIFNSSPDETAYYHAHFMKMNCSLSINSIQPQLYEYKDEDGKRIPLDSVLLESTENGAFLIMDSVFQVCFYQQGGGLKLHHSNNDDYFMEKKPEVAGLIEFTEKNFSRRESIVPSVVLTQTGHSQSRFLISRLNPVERETDNTPEKPVQSKSIWGKIKKMASPTPSYDAMRTDDLSLKQYYDGVVAMIQQYRVESDD